MSTPIIECVPNFSEGRDQDKIDSIAKAIASVHGTQLLHIDSGYDANRTVFTLAGPPKDVVESMVQGFRTANQLCNMAHHLGTHPRLGLLDVCPFIPLSGASMADAHQCALDLSARLEAEFDQTIYLYEKSAKNQDRQNLAHIRKGEYEGLERKLRKEDWVPDFGSTSFLPRTGASIIGARPFLIAYNVHLNTKSTRIADQVAKAIRTSGYLKELAAGGLKQRVPGLLPSCKAIGWYVEEYNCAQVSMNLVDFEVCGMHEAYEACRHIARSMGADVVGSELIGLIPLKAILQSGKFYAAANHTLDRSESALIQQAIDFLGLSNKAPFDPQKRIIEYQLKAD